MKISDYLNAVYFILNIYRIRRLYFDFRKIPVARFIVFHDIPIGAKNQFENNIRILKKYTNLISLNEFMTGNMDIGAFNTVITFDDGYKSWVDIALPVLKKYEIKATFFISSSYIRESDKMLSKTDSKEYQSRSNIYKSYPNITAEDIIRLKDANQIIGGHTLNHISLIREKDFFIIEKEISKDKEILESIAGSKIKYFAYPFGHVNSGLKIRKLLLSIGYEAAVTLNPGFNSKYTDIYLLHRDLVSVKMNSISFLSHSLGKKDIKIFIYDLIHGNLFRKHKGVHSLKGLG